MAPHWLSAPGAPPAPLAHSAFRASVAPLLDLRASRLDELRALRAQLGPREAADGAPAQLEREALQQRLSDIDAARKREQDQRFRKNEEIARVQRTHEERAAKLRELSGELSGFSSLREIDAAVAHVTRRMESSGGGLAAERRAVRQLARLEAAKSYLLELQPLTEAMAEAKHKEATLQREWQEINERVRQLNGEYNEQRAVRQQRAQESRAAGADRQEIFKKIAEVRGKIKEVSDVINAKYEEQNKAVEAWNAWREEAQKKYAAQKKAEWEERQRQRAERQQNAKLEEKRQRALRAQEVHKVELAACTVLVRYLRDQREMTLREEAAKERENAAATFDLASHLPPGAVMINSGQKATDTRKPGGKKAKQQKNNNAPQSKNQKSQTKGKHTLQHSEEKLRLFRLIGEEPPTALEQIEDAIARIQKKMEEYSTFIHSEDDLELSSDHEEEEEEEKEKEEEEEKEKEKETAKEEENKEEPKEKEEESEEKKKEEEEEKEGEKKEEEKNDDEKKEEKKEEETPKVEA